jgi:tRNA pseudouridine55 synthase
LKHEGVPLYKLARQGRPVQKPSRQVNISHIDILDIDLPEIRFAVSCSAGTYIRTLCNDIGKSLGCGGCLKQLRRVESCGFTIKDAITLKELEDLSSSGRLPDQVIGMADSLRGMPEYAADSFLAEKIRHGVKISKKNLLSNPVDNAEGFIKITNADKDLIAVLSHQSTDSDFHYCCVFHTGD